MVAAARAALLSGAHAAELRALLEARGVLVFARVGFTADELIAFTRTLGEYVSDRADGGVTTISLDPAVADNAQYTRASAFWHFDGYFNERPILGSILAAEVLPADGGDTWFASTYAAYEALPDERKRQIEGLKAVHALAAAQRAVEPEPSAERFGEWRRTPHATLPLVWTHRSGRRSLVVGNTAAGVVGMDPLDSLELLTWLRAFATQDRFVHRHVWSVGDVVLWDNTGTLHKVTPYPADSGRRMIRTKLAGEEPVR